MKVLLLPLLSLVTFGEFNVFAQAPTISAGGVLNAASFATGQVVAAGSLVSIFGTNLAAGAAVASTLPLQPNLGGVSVTVNGTSAGLLFVSSTQINAQLPWETQAGTASIVVSNNGVSSAPQTFQVGVAAPGIFSAQYGMGQAIAINLDGTLSASATLYPGSHTAKEGDTIILLATGLGPVTPTVADGANSADQLRTTTQQPTVTIGGIEATVTFSGLSPQFTGVYQLNVIVPYGVTDSETAPVQIASNGITSTSSVTMAVGYPPDTLTIPSDYQDTFTYVQGLLSAFNTQITTGWDGTKSAVLFGGEFSPADSYVSLTNPSYYNTTALPYLNALQTLGVKVVKFQLGFPLLYQPFYTGYLKDTNLTLYNARLSFYKQLVSDLRSRGIKIIVQSVITPAQNGAYAGDPLDLSDYYSTLSFDDYIAGRTQNAVTAAQELLPDFINIESEPDNEGSKALQPELDDPANNLLLVMGILSGLESAGIPGLHTTLKVAAGMGSWQENVQTYITNYVSQPSIDVIDIHVHAAISSSTLDTLQEILTICNGAVAAGKELGMDEDWLNKTSPNDQTSDDTSVGVDTRNTWSFWAPIDELFVQTMVNVTYTQKMQYVSFSEPNEFFAYIPYTDTSGCSSTTSSSCSTPNVTEMSAVTQAVSHNPPAITPTGQAFMNYTAP